MKLTDKFSLSKQSSLLALITLAVMVLTTSNLPSAQNEARSVEITQNKIDMLGIDTTLSLIQVTPGKLPDPIGSAWVDTKPQNIVKDELQAKIEQPAPVEKISAPKKTVQNEEKTAQSAKLTKPQTVTTEAATVEKENSEELQILKTVRVSHKAEMKIFQKDMSALQTWRYAVQVAAIYGEDSADDLVEYLSNKGYSPVIWESEDKRGNKFQRIWIGLYQDGKRAQKAREYYKTHENKHAFVTPVAWETLAQ